MDSDLNLCRGDKLRVCWRPGWGCRGKMRTRATGERKERNLGLKLAGVEKANDSECGLSMPTLGIK